MTTLLLFLWLIVIAGNVYADRMGRKPNYLQVNTIRIALAIVHCALFDPQANDWRTYLPVFVFQITSYFIFFPWWLNIVTRKKPAFLYIDRVEHDSGWTDRALSRFSNDMVLVFKLAAGAAMLWALFQIYAVH